MARQDPVCLSSLGAPGLAWNHLLSLKEIFNKCRFVALETYLLSQLSFQLLDMPRQSWQASWKCCLHKDILSPIHFHFTPKSSRRWILLFNEEPQLLWNKMFSCKPGEPLVLLKNSPADQDNAVLHYPFSITTLSFPRGTWSANH